MKRTAMRFEKLVFSFFNSSCFRCLPYYPRKHCEYSGPSPKRQEEKNARARKSRSFRGEPLVRLFRRKGSLGGRSFWPPFKSEESLSYRLKDASFMGVIAARPNCY